MAFDKPVRVWEFGNLAVDVIREVDEGVELFEVKMLSLPEFDAHWGRTGVNLLATQIEAIPDALRAYVSTLGAE